ncbi:MAG: metal-dependent hydrolase, partial [bacterium]
MTVVGHSLFGLTLGVAFAPTQMRLPARIFYYLAVIFCANIPDLPFDYWGHQLYFFSHNIFITLFIIVELFMISLLLVPEDLLKQRDTKKIYLVLTLVWLSHLLLDSFYMNGRGVPILWPLSEERLRLPLPWLYAIRPPVPSLQQWPMYLADVATILPLLLL